MSNPLIIELPGNFRAIIAEMVSEENICNDLSPVAMENEISKRMEQVAGRMMKDHSRYGVRILAGKAFADIGTKVPT